MPLPKSWKCELDVVEGPSYLGILRLRDGTLRLTGPYKSKPDAWCHIRLLAEEDNIRWDEAFLIRTVDDGLLNCSDYGPKEKRWIRLKE